MLVTGKAILKHAHENGYAVGAFNVNTMEQVQAIIEAAEETKSPVIIQASQGGLKYAGVEYIAAMVKTAAEKASVPVALHLDHGTDFKQIMLCLRNGFTSVMIDGSHYELEENIKKTKQIVEMAHAVGVSVEAELGKIGGTEDDISVDEKDATFTDPDEAERFVKETEVDYLAIAVGTAHGPYKGEPKIDFDRIKTIKERLDMPLVLHGSSGVPEESIKKAVSLGINKINIDTDIRMAFHRAVKKFISENPDVYDPRKILGPAKEEMKKVIKEKMIMFGSAEKAW
ncbi:fructose-bisphosphate aldolase, class II [Caminicella sporogenes DSM 14501]|uniref:Fructose-bisphosphate aldolase, class II n=1 Tax=Caminicella sporogenes DSM 14501 TaxID=1121266 RepID=A0A1M6QAB8_9FIRM|nr:class II fructose-1,6-bisphosphate aldolase [Caminicella sporogenes]RKD23637.1 fructose-1,6-bisphosphate aldolase, class II [Caminicella sporogenes]WIF93978.1 class II fructose-1,6-bisphosphate aldolase [Caminicella sporogenes]SHK17095.1 fructose-bisphosphate aldolase, class II [Caminicella sporogenes DSM 14501]